MQPQIYYNTHSPIDIDAALRKFIDSYPRPIKKALLLPPDMTRLHSLGGVLCSKLYRMLKDTAQVDIMPALGTHEPMNKAERTAFFGDIPDSAFFVHNWRNDVIKLGEVPADYVRDVSEGIVDEPIAVEVNKILLEGGYDIILSLGQVVPHEVVGMANYTKNIVVGIGGSTMINQSHMLGALYGMERMMGRADTPVRKVFDYAQQHFLSQFPITYMLTVTTNTSDGVVPHGLFIGDTRDIFEAAAKLSQEKNLIFVTKPFKKAVVYLDPSEFKSTWLGNKAIYRTRMAMADGGELIVLAPGVSKFGEDGENDRLIRKFGYVGREKILELYKQEPELQTNQSVAAHLVHGSSDGRFTVTYCTKLVSEDEVRNVAFNWMSYDQAVERYDPAVLSNGINIMPDGEEIFYIDNPALGLWADRTKF